MNELITITCGQSLNSYLEAIRKFDSLSAEEEVELANKLITQNDVTAAHKLILAHLGYVVSIAKSYMGYGLPLSDLIQEGNIGLMKAVRRFKPDGGARLSTFASMWIKAEICEFVLRNWHIVKIATTKAQRKLFFKLRSMKKQLSFFNSKELQTVASSLNVEVSDVSEMEQRLLRNDISLNTSPDDDIKSVDVYLEDNRYDPSEYITNLDSELYNRQQLKLALPLLDERSLKIIKRRWLDGNATLKELALEFGISLERIRQIEVSAFKKLRTAMS